MSWASVNRTRGNVIKTAGMLVFIFEKFKRTLAGLSRQVAESGYFRKLARDTRATTVKRLKRGG
jgi:hypothetical protein